MMLAPAEQIREESLWFGSDDQPLFGRLTTPAGETTRGGVLMSPPIGRESRLARRALRTLAIYLAFDGYVSLRFDHFGTGDSSGSMDDEFDGAWVEGIDHGVALLRSLGISSISAVGMRMGATILGTAASRNEIDFSSLVMWDPCESGRTYVRELGALGALRRDITKTEVRESTKMLEYPLSDGAVSGVNQFRLTDPAVRPLAKRLLVVVRDDRTVSSKFRARWDSEHVEWATTSEQALLLESELPTSVPPESTIELIRTWLTAPENVPTPFSSQPRSSDAIVVRDPNAFSVRETAVTLGFRKMFGVVTEPVGDTRGPLLVMVNGINEDHVGPSRLWVELSRRWASVGIRSLRFDFSELGESPWLPSQPKRPMFDRTLRQDIVNAVRALNLTSPDDVVLIGLCSGAQLALEVALELKARGVCTINPQVGAGVLRSADVLKNSDRDSIRSYAKRVESVLKRHQWLSEIILRISRLVLLSAYSPKVRSTLIKNHTEMLLLLSPNDLSPFGRIPIIGSLENRRFVSSEYLQIEIVPGLDHDFLSTVGRTRAVSILDRHVVKTYAGAHL
jgi:dienelactone hydrolase